jgi:hypothetical protein
MKNDSPEYSARIALVEEMRALRLADETLNRPKSSTTELQQRALRVLHGDKLKASVRKELLSKAGERNGQAIARTTGRNTKPTTPEEKAKQGIREWLIDNAESFEDRDGEI